MMLASTPAPRGPDRSSGRFRAGLGALAVVVAGGTWGAAHRPARAGWWGGSDRFDVVLAAPRPLDGWGLLLALLPVAALLQVRRTGRPAVLGCAVALAALVGYLLAGYPFGPVFVPVVAAVLLTARAGRRVLAWSTAAVMAAAGTLALVLRGAVVDTLLLASVPWIAVLLLAGEGLRVRRERQAVARSAQAAQLESRVATERLAIAREVHDVLAHSLSAINVQAGVGLHLMDADPAQARTSLQAVKDTSKQALEEVRGVIGALRGDGDVPMAPTPGLADIAGLLQEVRSTGVRVSADVPDDAAVPARVGAAAYRIVQESLTNVRRHGARPEAAVTVVVGGGRTAVTVRSPLPGAVVGDPPAAPGHGIAGMRERAEALGGHLHAGPEGGDFVVRAELPTDGAR